jgi:hypothetical protein
VIAFVLGTMAAGLVLFVAGLALGVAAGAAGWGSFRIGIGPVVLVEFDRGATFTGTTLGNAVPLAALACGVLNAAGAAALRRRAG